MAQLALPVKSPSTGDVSQGFAGAADAEPNGWFVDASDGRPLKASRVAIAGWTKHIDFHQGQDQFGPIDRDLFAIEAGKVLRVSPTLGEIEVAFQGHTDSKYLFAHCNSILVKVGANVAKGQHIGEMGKRGNASGSHDHTQISFFENGRWVQYDPARFYPEKTFRFAPFYRATAIAKGYCDKDGYLFGGTHIYDDRIYPIRKITINEGVNVRADKNVTAPVVTLTKAITPAMQINEVPGGAYVISGVGGNIWAKVKLTVAGVVVTGYVAKPLIKV